MFVLLYSVHAGYVSGVSGYLLYCEQSKALASWNHKEVYGVRWGGELCLFSLTWPWFYWSLKCVFYVHMWHLPSGKVLVVSEVASMDTDAFSSLASTDIWGVSGWVRVSLEGTQSSPDPWPWDLNQTWAPGLSSIADAQFWKYRKTKPGCVEQSHLSWRMIDSIILTWTILPATPLWFLPTDHGLPGGFAACHSTSQ